LEAVYQVVQRSGVAHVASRLSMLQCHDVLRISNTEDRTEPRYLLIWHAADDG